MSWITRPVLLECSPSSTTRVPTSMLRNVSTSKRYPDIECQTTEVLSVRVSSRSTITVRRILYTVPSRLVGRQLEIHLYHNRLRGYLGQNCVVEIAPHSGYWGSASRALHQLSPCD